ncbi:MAG TPA: carboxypeptidase-like regulatory domain-containing protein, partial [Gemmatimonadaceae bacterium]
MTERTWQVVTILALAANVAAAQGTASISGIVRDSANRPLSDADVVAIPARAHARTDSTGRFAFRALENAKYVVRARRVGYVPVEWTVDLSKGGHADVQIVFSARLPVLDTVRVMADRTCEPRSYEGFM